jgi:uncharacterized protein YcfL
MKQLLILGLLLCFGAMGCSNKEEKNKVSTQSVKTTKTDNIYEIVNIGPYTCVGMDGYESGAIWCERTKP